MKSKIIKNIMTVAMSLILLLPLMIAVVPETKAAESDPAYSKIKERGVLVVGLSADYAPFEFHTTVDGKDKIVGFEVDMAKEIAKDLGSTLR